MSASPSLSPSLSLSPSPDRSHRDTRRTPTFPSVTLATRPGRVPTEVNLVARLGRGAGDKLYFDAEARQRRHDRFVDELDEPSAKLGATDLAKGDATALYSFGVGAGGHPFHRHAGHRVFTAVSGSGGAQLRFSNATLAEIEQDPARFVDSLQYVDVPADCLFTVRFSGETWHQFAPLVAGSAHPAFFALSTHTNELGGELSPALRDRVLADQGDIASLTQLLPHAVQEHLRASPPSPRRVPTTALSLHDRPGSLLESACKLVRSSLGHFHRIVARIGTRPGFISRVEPPRVIARHRLQADSLLRAELSDRLVHHQDCFAMRANVGSGEPVDAGAWLAALLEGFLRNQPRGVSRLMRWRNLMVRPLSLRTSPLGCPVSSLLAPPTGALFDARFPVRSQQRSADGRCAQVVLGADDRHLVFRSCVGVRLRSDGTAEFSLATRVACTNAFGRVYMALISKTHRHYIAPTMLAHAVVYAVHRGSLRDRKPMSQPIAANVR